MRIFLQFKSSTFSPAQTDVRKKFLSFIKKTFETSLSNVFKEIFSEKKFRPYVFSPFFGRKFKEGILGPELSFIFSSGNYEIISNFWNGILELKKKREDYIAIGENLYYLENTNLIKSKNIKNKEVFFKTIGICILTDPEKKANDFNDWFLVPTQDKLEHFNKVLLKRTLERMEFLENNINNAKLELIPEKIKVCILPHYGGYLKGFKGTFKLKGNPEVLQFLYDYGMGVRTGQGFGLLDIVKEP